MSHRSAFTSRRVSVPLAFGLCALVGCGAVDPDASRAGDSGFLLGSLPTGTHGPAPEAAGSVHHVALRLETRSGEATRGWSFDVADLVDADAAHLLLSSWDCGARGRWVTLLADGVELCGSTASGALDPTACGRESVEIGGSQPEVELGDVLYVRTASTTRALRLVDRTETPFDWYEADDLSFEVELEYH